MSDKQTSEKFKLLPSVKFWLANVNFQKTPEEHSAVVDAWFDAFLLTDDADDKAVRGDVMLMRDNFKNLFFLMAQVAEPKRTNKLHTVL